VVLVSSVETGASPGGTMRVSVDSAGNQGNGDSWNTAISADGRYVAFMSGASNLVPGDTNGQLDVFVHDRGTGATSRVSVDSSGNQANAESGTPFMSAAISADGRYVAFYSGATNLVPGDTNNTSDIFVHDRETGVTERVSVDSAGVQGNSASGQFAAISGDGRFVAFDSDATNLVAGDTNGVGDVFVHDRQTGVTQRVSVDSAGNQGNGYSYDATAISADGRFVGFKSQATNLVPGDTNGAEDIFVHDRQTGVTQRVSVDSAGNQGNGWSEGPAISADGRYVAFYSLATNLVPGDTNGQWDVFVHDRQTGVTQRVSVDSAGNQGNGGSMHTAISADGRYVAFMSSATNLVPGDTNGAEDIFVHDRQTGVTQRVSVDSAGNQGNDVASVVQIGISADGRYVAFSSNATNLVPDDTNGCQDVFVHDRGVAAVGGIVELQRERPALQARHADSSAPNYPALAALAALGLAALTAGAWYARRRRAT
jgi:Tol biopolymer transport system component